MSDGRAAMRRTMFLSQDGVVLCMTLRGLDELGILAPSLEGERSLAELHPELTEAGFGALRIALHSLAGAGWIDGAPGLEPTEAVLRWNEAGRLAARHHRTYVALGDFLAGFAGTDADAWRRPWDAAQVECFLELAGPAAERWSLDPDVPVEPAALIRAHLDSGLLVPTMLWLHETDRLGVDAPDLPDGDLGEGMGQLLAALGWLDGSSGRWTETGRQARAFGLNFGGVATYLPLLARLPELYRGELSVEPTSADDNGEWHVHRELNLRISTAAHRRYFAESESIFTELFDREPIGSQPIFIADMGCGEGSWLVHLHGLIRERTRRGKQLEAHPLTMVGIDPDPGAREMARRNLEAAGAPALVIPGDVTDPDGLRETLAEHGLAIEDGLHIRAFIDHERTYRGGEPDGWVPGWSSGVYIDGDGRPLSGEAIERDLIAHLRRWEPHVRKHGLLVLEAHCVAPRIVARHAGSLHGIAFDAHQAYSKQYPSDHAAFLRCCQEAGLQPAVHSERRYPRGRSFVSITLNRLLASGAEEPLPALEPGVERHDTWVPPADADLEDGKALHEILFTGGDIRHPALWCSPPTGFVVGGALEAIERRLATAAEGDAIRIMDYGAGTGTATIELLKACRERGIEDRLGRAGASLELHLVDIPSSWFAQGYELLGDCAWTRFHSLRGDRGFRPLLEVTAGASMDAVMANMVFHLIPPKPLELAARELAGVLRDGGELLWSAPDLGPPGREAVLLHDPNRMLRELWLGLLGGGIELASGSSAEPSALDAAVRRAREELDEEARRRAQERADRRIRPRPLATEVTAALAPSFSGEIETTAYEMLNEEVVRGLLVPSNQAEYLPEIRDRELREEVIRELMLGEVLPSLQEGPAGTSLGLNLHWTLGAFAKRS